MSGGAGAGGDFDTGGEGGGSDTGGQGEGGAGEPTCDDARPCIAGSYCGADGLCRSCSDLGSVDLASVRFKAPEPLSVINNAAGDFLLRMPRTFGTGKALLYVRDFFGGEIWYTGDPERDLGAPLMSPINSPTTIDSYPVWFGTASGALEAYNFVFGRASASGAPAELYGAALAANGTTSKVARLPAPFNPDPPLSQSAYSMAVSHDRAWWMINRDLMLGVQFLTMPLDQSGPPSVVSLRHSADCKFSEFDVAAWVTPDGKVLFTDARERGADCSVRTGEPHDIFMFQLDEAGQTRGYAVPVAGVSRPNAHEIDASLSADMCWLYFVAKDSDKLRIMRAQRER
jgi:hypothetical protein